MISQQVLSIVLLATAGSALPIFSSKSGSSAYNADKPDQSHMFPFLGGSAPYFAYPISDQYYKIDTAIPEQCTLKQVQSLGRHGERYPGYDEGNTIIDVYNKIASVSKKNLENSEYLSFMVDPLYEFFLSSNASLELLTTTNDSINGVLNPYAGELTAKKFGTAFAEKYQSIIGDKLPVFTASNLRVFKTASYFSDMINQYLGTEIDMQVLNELAQTGGNSLTPSETCNVWDVIVHQDIIDDVDDTYLVNIANKLNNATKGLNLTTDDASTLFTWCAYEIDAAGYSPICDIFTQEELVWNSVADDVYGYYVDGPGNPLIKSVGSVFFNASVELLKNPPKSYSAYVSFAHDVNIQHYVAAIGLFDDEIAMTSDFDFSNTNNKKSWIVPMGARIQLENYECGNSSYVRYILNDAVIPIPKCNTGPGFSCEVNDFYKYYDNRMSNITDFATACNITDLPTYQSFYWDYQSVNYTAPIEVQSY
ncbi:unnamed protein product [Hanseniaspora opuntiae]